MIKNKVKIQKRVSSLKLGGNYKVISWSKVKENRAKVGPLKQSWEVLNVSIETVIGLSSLKEKQSP